MAARPRRGPGRLRRASRVPLSRSAPRDFARAWCRPGDACFAGFFSSRRRTTTLSRAPMRADAGLAKAGVRSAGAVVAALGAQALRKSGAPGVVLVTTRPSRLLRRFTVETYGASPTSRGCAIVFLLPGMTRGSVRSLTTGADGGRMATYDELVTMTWMVSRSPARSWRLARGCPGVLVHGWGGSQQRYVARRVRWRRSAVSV